MLSSLPVLSALALTLRYEQSQHAGSYNGAGPGRSKQGGGCRGRGRNVMAASTTRRAFVLGAGAAPLLAGRTFAQAGFPPRPRRLVIGFPPGGGVGGRPFAVGAAVAACRISPASC